MTHLAERIEAHLQGRGEVTEGRVLSGNGYFLDGHLVAAVIADDLCMNVGSEAWPDHLETPGVDPLRIAGRPVPGWIMVDGSTVTGDDALAGWVEQALVRRSAPG
jgi:hypothetical protein